MTPRQANTIASAWGLAEATVFIIVPDVFLSRVALRSVRQGLVACSFALLGALIGGAVMWVWGRSDPAGARVFLESLPAISGTMIDSVNRQLSESGTAALVAGPLRGIPYKVYAVEAAYLGHGFGAFLAISIAARLSRFVIVTVLFGLTSRALRHHCRPATVRLAHVLTWTAFYVGYFWQMSAP